MSKYQLFTLHNIPTANFILTALELKDYINFAVQRVYFISTPMGEHKTGQHAHRQHEDELFVQVQGSCIITVDDGHGLEKIKLAGPQSAILIPHLVWHGFEDMSPDCLILALSSTNYDPARADYCENYEEFKQLTRQV